MNFAVHVEIAPRSGISDPEGQTIERALPVLGFSGVSGVRVGKLITFDIEADDVESARLVVDDMCARFLSNPVIEDVKASLGSVDLLVEVSEPVTSV